MNFGEWEAKIYESIGSMGYELWLFRNTPGHFDVLTHDGTLKKRQEGVGSPGDYFARFSREQMKVIANAFDNFGIVTDSNAKNAGLLEATKAHLEDMRTLVLGKNKK